MAQSFFVWNGIDCRTMGVKVLHAIPIIRPEERVEHITIPGRSGDLTRVEGDTTNLDYIYNSYIQTVTIAVHGWSRVREVYRWLRGDGYVTFHGEYDRRQKARIIGAITLDRHSPNLDWWEGEVQFYCQPLKELLAGNTQQITAAGNVYAEGDVLAKPKWTVTVPSGQTSFWLSAGGRRIDVTGITAGVYVVDSEIQEITPAEGVGILTSYSTGEFPVLVPGTNYVNGANWSKVVIDKRERFL